MHIYVNGLPGGEMCVHFQKAIDAAIESGLTQDNDEVCLVRSVNLVGLQNKGCKPVGVTRWAFAQRVCCSSLRYSIPFPILTVIGPRCTGPGPRPRA